MAKIKWEGSSIGERCYTFPARRQQSPNTCMRFPDGWYLHDQSGFDESGQVAGPFPDLESCKAAYLLMWGTT